MKRENAIIAIIAVGVLAFIGGRLATKDPGGKTPVTAQDPAAPCVDTFSTWSHVECAHPLHRLEAITNPNGTTATVCRCPHDPSQPAPQSPGVPLSGH